MDGQGFQIAVRAAVADDFAGVLDLYSHLNPEEPLPPIEMSEKAWEGLLYSGLTTVFVADAGDALLSTCTLIVIPNLTRNARSIGVIENVVTHRDHRRRGHARAVLQAALNAAKAANCYKVMLSTGSTNPDTLRFYESVGFTQGEKTFFQVRFP